MGREIRKVHVIYKTHLDIGFTDYAEKVKRNYVKNFVPRAIALAERMNEDGKPKRFVWTTGSWIIDECLRQEDKAAVRRLEEAIRKGHVRWHGLPFTTHTELMDKRSFEYGLSVSKRLDTSFDMRTIAAKMTDIPGHTKAMVPILARHGIRYLHIGVNPSSKVPDVPEVFLWQGQDGSQVIVNYAAGYGEILEPDYLDEVLAFAHTGDNMGPGDEAAIADYISFLQQKYPHAAVEASTLDGFAGRLWEARDCLPVVTEEIGDTWIHGVAADPKKVSHYKALLRCAERWLEEKRLEAGSAEYEGFFSQLILIPEHTWGMDLKTHFGDFRNYSKKDFRAARRRDAIKDAVPPEYSFISEFVRRSAADQGAAEVKTYSGFEESWKEQRRYIDSAIQCLSEDKRREAHDRLLELSPVYRMPEGKRLDADREYRIGDYDVIFAEDGSIKGLSGADGIRYADGTHRIGRYVYEIFGPEDYTYWFEHYQRDMERHYEWCIPDFGKPGLELAEKPVAHARYSGKAEKIILQADGGAESVFIQLSMPPVCHEDYGSPEKLLLAYHFGRNGVIEFELNWFNKEASRIPEASWCEFGFCCQDETEWLLKKMDGYISPYGVVSNGSRNLHAVEEIVYRNEKRIAIEPLDAPLVSIGEAKILKFDNKAAGLSNGMYFNLHNNVWGTNFPMWFEEDMKYRFILTLG